VLLGEEQHQCQAEQVKDWLALQVAQHREAELTEVEEESERARFQGEERDQVPELVPVLARVKHRARVGELVSVLVLPARAMDFRVPELRQPVCQAHG